MNGFIKGMKLVVNNKLSIKETSVLIDIIKKPSTRKQLYDKRNDESMNNLFQIFKRLELKGLIKRVGKEDGCILFAFKDE